MTRSATASTVAASVGGVSNVTAPTLSVAEKASRSSARSSWPSRARIAAASSAAVAGRTMANSSPPMPDDGFRELFS